MEAPAPPPVLGFPFPFPFPFQLPCGPEGEGRLPLGYLSDDDPGGGHSKGSKAAASARGGGAAAAAAAAARPGMPVAAARTDWALTAGVLLVLAAIAAGGYAFVSLLEGLDLA